jgi:hypothetical protein
MQAIYDGPSGNQRRSSRPMVPGIACWSRTRSKIPKGKYANHKAIPQIESVACAPAGTFSPKKARIGKLECSVVERGV